MLRSVKGLRSTPREVSDVMKGINNLIYTLSNIMQCFLPIYMPTISHNSIHSHSGKTPHRLYLQHIDTSSHFSKQQGKYWYYHIDNGLPVPFGLPLSLHGHYKKEFENRNGAPHESIISAVTWREKDEVPR
jgi:hypothetical protein